MSLTEQLAARQKTNHQQTRDEYLNLIARDCSGTTNAGDAAVLAEVLTALGKTEADFSRDSRTYGNFLSEKSNADAFELANPPAQVKIDTEAAHCRLVEAQNKLGEAQRGYQDAIADYNNQCGRRRMRELYSEQVQRAKESCGALLNE